MSRLPVSNRRAFLQGSIMVSAAGMGIASGTAAGQQSESGGMLTQLAQNSWPQVERYLEGSDGIIIPIGSTEQHGPNGPIGTDAICAEIVARETGRQVGAMVAPTLTIGMAQHHLAFPGTIALQPTTLIAVISDVVRSLAVQGFRHIYFLNGHGGNVAILQAAFQEIRAQSSLRGIADEGLYLRADNWYSGERTLALSRQMFGERDGSHAKPSEISLAWHAWPEAVQPMTSFDPPVAARSSGPFGDASDFRARFPDGRVGADPSGASMEAGARLFAACVEDTIENYSAFLMQT